MNRGIVHTAFHRCDHPEARRATCAQDDAILCAQCNRVSTHGLTAGSDGWRCEVHFWIEPRKREVVMLNTPGDMVNLDHVGEYVFLDENTGRVRAHGRQIVGRLYGFEPESGNPIVRV